jgi:hypothetical protein
MHIPKTAGSTFRQVLVRQYPDKGCFIFQGDIAADIERFQALSDKEKQNIALFEGHAPVTTGIQEADQTVITLLRDPVRRVMSFCQHVYEGKSPYLLQLFPPEKFSLDDFLGSGNTELSNLQTKMLINQGRSSSSSDGIDQLTVSEATTLAIKNLSEKIACFGLQEYFDESLVLFATRFGWQALSYKSVNTANSSRKLDFRDTHIKRITELNAIDIEVYKLAREKFLEQIHRKDFDAGRLRRLKSTQHPGSFLGKLGRKLIRYSQ